MKKYISLILLTIAPAWMFAEPIDSLEARQVATSFMHSLTEPGGFKSARLMNYQCQKDRNLYILNEANGGWVIISADDCVRPILAYSPDGEFSIDNIAPAAKTWIDSYNEQIEIVQKRGLKRNANISKEWEQLRNGDVRRGTTQYVVEPLIKTKWNQSTYYNNFCPTIDGKNTLTGCVATAMAQVMNYWQWPKKGVGFHEYKSQNCGTVASVFGLEYEWDNMPEQLGYFSSDNSVDAVADIMYDCGVSVDMDYGLDGSNINNPQKVKDAMVKYFKYSPNMTLEEKENYTDDEWIEKLKNELNSQRPLLYYGFGDGVGHAFICDGYATENSNYYFHFNWGWSGIGDGYYYAINSLEPIDGDGQNGSNSCGTYSENQSAYFDVEPLYSIKEYDMRVYDNSLLAFDGNGNPMESLWLGNDAYYRAKIANYGDMDFSGTVAVVVFDFDSRFVSISNKVHIELQSNYHTTNDVEFKIEGSFAYVTYKHYIAAIVYKDDQTDEWTIVSDNLGLSSMLTFDVNYSTNISINSPITVYDNFKKEAIPTQELTRGDEYTCTVSIVNIGNNDYTGRYVLSLANTKGEFVQQIGIYEQNQPLKPNETRSIMFQDTIDVEPGTYILNVSFWNEEGWFIAGAINGGSNPVLFDVIEEYLPDEYEDNNTIENAYVFPLKFDSDNCATVITYREESSRAYFANLHEFGDVDYYKFNLKQGYNYTIDATLINNNDGTRYSLTADDATIEYSYDGRSWFEGHDYKYRCSKSLEDDDRYDELEVNGKGTVYVRIYHPWGMEGKYVFVAAIERSRENTPATAIVEDAVNAVNIYATGNTIIVENATDEIRVYNAMGALVDRDVARNVSTIRINNPGVYIVKTGVTVKRVMIN
ncbi:MAG: thiol protease/hemagglutinin PrtT [Salinivirgaceae bacterium]|nr:thiol protease/hemagglutinin PrtT [Salinivirgaceae bacterium]